MAHLDEAKHEREEYHTFLKVAWSVLFMLIISLIYLSAMEKTAIPLITAVLISLAAIGIGSVISRWKFMMSFEH